MGKPMETRWTLASVYILSNESRSPCPLIIQILHEIKGTRKFISFQLNSPAVHNLAFYDIRNVAKCPTNMWHSTIFTSVINTNMHRGESCMCWCATEPSCTFLMQISSPPKKEAILLCSTLNVSSATTHVSAHTSPLLLNQTKFCRPENIQVTVQVQGPPAEWGTVCVETVETHKTLHRTHGVIGSLLLCK